MNSKNSCLKFVLFAILLTRVATAEATAEVKAGATPAAPETPLKGAPNGAAATAADPTAASPLVASDGAEPVRCQKKLLVSLGLEGRSTAKAMSLQMCTGIKNSCCRHSDQLTIFDNWVKSNEYNGLNDLLADQAAVYNRVLDMAGQASERAKTIIDLLKDKKKSNCKLMATKIVAYDITNNSQRIKDNTKVMHDFFKNSYKGFYCAVCDADNHKFLDVRGQRFVYSTDFCRNITKNSLNFLLYYHVYFNKYLNLITRFLNNCDNNGKYTDAMIRNAPSFQVNPVVGHKLTACRKYRNESFWLDHCGDICNAWQITKYNDFFSPNLKKFDRFNRFVARKLAGHKRKAASDAAAAAAAAKEENKDGAAGGDAKGGAPAAKKAAKSRRLAGEAAPAPTPAPTPAPGPAGATPAPAAGDAAGAAPAADKQAKVTVMTAEELEVQLIDIYEFERNPSVIIAAMGSDLDIKDFSSKYKDKGLDPNKSGNETNISDAALTTINYEEDDADEKKATIAFEASSASGQEKGDKIVSMIGGLLSIAVILLIK